jgi:FkbM family methyltransferase
LLRRFGVDVVRWPGRTQPLGRRLSLLRHHKIDVVLDVGANEGQYASLLRRIGWTGRIVSFEPLPEPFGRLDRRAARDKDWTAVNVALGERDGEGLMHVAGNVVSSSFLTVLPAHVAAAPDSGPVGDLRVPIRRLDSVFDEHVRPGERPFLKIDAQGYEQFILEGASASLPRIDGLQLELSLVPLYEGSALLEVLIDNLRMRGFELMGVEPGFADRHTGRLLQVDGVFFRPRADPEPKGGGA